MSTTFACCSSSSSARIASSVVRSTTRSLSKRQFAQKSSSNSSRNIRVVAADSSSNAASSPSSATAAAEKPEPELKSDVSSRFLFLRSAFCIPRARVFFACLSSLSSVSGRDMDKLERAIAGSLSFLSSLSLARAERKYLPISFSFR